MEDSGDIPLAERKRRKLFVYAGMLGLSRQERLDFAEKLLLRDFTSWKELDEAQMDRLLDGLEGVQIAIEISRLRTDESNDGVVAELHDRAVS